MFKNVLNKKKSEQDKLFELKYSLKIIEIRGSYEAKRNILEKDAARDGTINDGSHASKYVESYLEEAKEEFQSYYDIFKNEYRGNAFTSKSNELLAKKIDDMAKRNIFKLNNVMENYSAVNPGMKSSLKMEYERDLNKIISDLKKRIEIDFLDKKNSIKENEKKQAELLSDIKRYFGLRLLWENQKLLVIFILLFLLLFFFHSLKKFAP